MFMFSDAERSNVVLEGKWIRHVIVHNIWTRVFQGGGDSSFSANGFTRLENIKWGDFNESLAINQLKEGSTPSIKAAFRSGAASFEEGTEKTLEEHGTSTKKIESSVDKAVEEVKTDADKVLAKEGTSTDQVHEQKLPYMNVSACVCVCVLWFNNLLMVHC